MGQELRQSKRALQSSAASHWVEMGFSQGPVASGVPIDPRMQSLHALLTVVMPDEHSLLQGPGGPEVPPSPCAPPSVVAMLASPGAEASA